MNEEGIESSAILLLSIGEEEAAGVFKDLAPSEVQKLGQAMAKLGNVTREKIDAVLGRFRGEAEQQTSLGLNSDDYIRGVLNKALGAEKADLLLDRILGGNDSSGIEGLKWMDSTGARRTDQGEHPQIIASIFASERDQASAVLGKLSEQLRSDVLLRIATLDEFNQTPYAN
jgi:flagellar motor switch protein FliG